MSDSKTGSLHRLMGYWWRFRRASIVLSAGWCILLGIGFGAMLVGQNALGSVDTLVLLGACGMVVLPGLTVLVLKMDSRERSRARVAAASARSVRARVEHQAKRRGSRAVLSHASSSRAARSPARDEEADRSALDQILG